MKLRLHADSLRLRLNQSEVAQLAATGRVEESITFAPGQSISYAIEAGSVPSVSASFFGNKVRVVLPEKTAKSWTEGDQVGIEGQTPTLKILLEKDFQCLHPQAEKEADAFPNPLAG